MEADKQKITEFYFKFPLDYSILYRPNTFPKT